MVPFAEFVIRKTTVSKVHPKAWLVGEVHPKACLVGEVHPKAWLVVEVGMASYLGVRVDYLYNKYTLAITIVGNRINWAILVANQANTK